MTLLNKIIFLVSAYFIPSRLYAENEKGGMPQLDPSSLRFSDLLANIDICTSVYIC